MITLHCMLPWMCVRSKGGGPEAGMRHRNEAEELLQADPSLCRSGARPDAGLQPVPVARPGGWTVVGVVVKAHLLQYSKRCHQILLKSNVLKSTLDFSHLII